MKRQLSFAIGAALLGASGAALAITDTETNASIPFNLANPGARSMGMGGAFLGLADDATAAYTNPAGLTQLVLPEVSVEARHTDYSIPYVNNGSATTSPFNGSGLNTADADSSNNNLSFFSIVYPHDRWSFAFYRDELVRYNASFSSDLNGESVSIGGTPNLLFPIAANANLKIVNYGVSAAWKAADNVSIGAGLSYYDFNINTNINRLALDGYFTNPGTVINNQQQFGSDNDIGVNLGARFVFSEQWSAGVVYRRGPKFSYQAANYSDAQIVGPDSNNQYTATPNSSPTLVRLLSNASFKVPDEYGAGLSWHPSAALVVNLDADYIDYSQLTRGMQGLLANSDGTPTNSVTTLSQLSIPNGAEVHLGGEYTFTQMTHPFSLRAGVWHDPRHSIEFKGDPGTDQGAVALAMLFYGGKGSQTHGSVGFGWAFTKFEIDGAADFSDLTDTYSLSAVYHF